MVELQVSLNYDAHDDIYIDLDICCSAMLESVVLSTLLFLSQLFHVDTLLLALPRKVVSAL